MSWKDRLYNQEQTPPSGVWEKITVALDESHLENHFPSVLYEAEATPPANAWKNITKTLDAETVPVIPVGRTRYSLFRYAAAVAVIALLGTGIFFLVRNNGTSVPVDMARNGDTIRSDRNNTPAAGQGNIAAASDDTNSQSTKSVADATNSPEKARKKSVYRAPVDVDGDEPLYAYNDNTPSIADRYVMLMTPNGIIRMSKKLGDMICCVAGQEQNEDCKDQVKKWQEKLAASPVAPAPGNFMDILTLVSELNQDDL